MISQYPYFRADNYEATPAELSVLNAAYDRLRAANPDIHPSNIADMLCNASGTGMTVESLLAAVSLDTAEREDA